MSSGKVDQALVRKPPFRQRFVRCRQRGHTPPALTTRRRHPCPLRRYVEALQEVGDGLDPLALFEPHAPQLPPYPAVEVTQVTATRCIAKVRHPARQERVEFRDHPFETHAPISPGDLADAVPGALKTHRSDAQAASRQQTVAQE